MKVFPLESLITGLLLSAGLSFFYYFGILITYNYLLESILFLISLTLICSLIFWINIKYDRMFDVVDVFSKTVSFDLKFSQPGFVRLLSLLRPVNPYAGVLGTLSGLLLALWAVPALIIYLAIHPDPPGKFLNIIVFFMCGGTGILYFISSKDFFPSAADKGMYFTGILLGSLGASKIFSLMAITV